MELLIPGLILVALMIWASTRIKRDAARAFEAETIETDEFVIQKPEGFLHNLNGRPEYVFEAYSKNFSGEHPSLRLGSVTISKTKGRSLDDIADELIRDGFTDQTSEIRNGHRHRTLDFGAFGPIPRHIKLGESDLAVYKLEIVTPQESSGDQWVETFIDSFGVK